MESPNTPFPAPAPAQAPTQTDKRARRADAATPTLPHPPEGVEVMTRAQAAAFLDVTIHTFGRWVKTGEIVITRYRGAKKAGQPIVYPVDELTRLRDERSQRRQPYPDPQRPGCYRVPIHTWDGDLEAIIDAEDLPKVVGKKWNYTLLAHGEQRAMVVRAGGMGGPAHTPLKRIILGVENRGADARVIHANGDALDCRRCNLVVRTPSQSTRRGYKYKTRAGRPTTSQYKGVCWIERVGQWLAQIRVDDVQRRLGFFDDEVEAAHAYDEAAREVWGKEARVNFPEPGELPSALATPIPATLATLLNNRRAA